jgi:hypothetical protein
MPDSPILGCLVEKGAGAYLIRPTGKSKKKKKRRRSGIDKLATDAAEQAIDAQQVVMQERMQSGDLGGGWNPSDQLIDNNS